MNPCEIENCLESMSIIVDTREQPSGRALHRYESFGVPYQRQKLDYGDYTYNFTLPNGVSYFLDDESIYPDVIVERKMDLEELSQCFCQSRKRFKAEFERALSHKANIYLLIEDGNWEKLLHGRYNTRFNSKAFTSSLVAWMVRYNIKVIFCQHEISGKLIKEILYRELKEKLESGFYG